eukprot:8257121-Pyramimonas_sp.AAC.1
MQRTVSATRSRAVREGAVRLKMRVSFMVSWNLVVSSGWTMTLGYSVVYSVQTSSGSRTFSL